MDISTEIRVLILEDVATDAALAERELRRAGIAFTSKRVETRDAFVKALDEFRPDIVLADYKLPAFDGLTAVQIVREMHPQVPVVMVTGTLGDEAAIELLKAGARDYVLKDRLGRLGAAVRQALSEEEGIRARKAAEKSLREEEEKYRTLFGEAWDGIVLIDDETGFVIDCNSQFERQSGRTLDQLKALRIWELCSPEKVETAKRIFFEVKHSGRGGDDSLELQQPDGTVVPIEFVAKTISIKNKPFVLSICRDISERRKAEHKIQMLARFPDENPNAVMRIDAAGTILYANQASARLLEYFDAKIGGHLKGISRDLVRDSLSGKEIRVVEVPHKERTFELAFAPIVAAGYVNVYGVDITQRKKGEARIAHLDRLIRSSRNITRLITRERDRGILLQSSCDILVREAGYRMVWIGLTEAGHHRVVPAAKAGLTAGYFESGIISWDETSTGQGPAGTAIRTRKRTVVQDIETDPLYAVWRETALKSGYRSSATFPLLADDRCYGVLNISMAMPSAFDAEELALIDDVTDDIAFALYGIDIENQRNRSEQALAASAIRFKALVENSSDLTVVFDADGISSYVSPSVKGLGGYEPDEVLGKNILAFIHPDDAQRAVSDMAKVTNIPNKIHGAQLRYRNKDGSYRTFETLTRNLLADPAVRGIVSNMRDVTEREEHRRDLEFKNIVLSTQQETSLDGILVVDENQKVISYNKRFMYMWGVPEEAVQSRSDERALQSIIDRLAVPDEFLAKIEYLYEHTEESTHDEVELKDGITFERYSAPMIGSNGRYFGRVWYFRDITERKQSGLALQSERDLAQRYLDITPSLILALDLNGNITLINEKGSDILECSQAEALGKNWFTKFLPERARERVEGIFARLLAGNPDSDVLVEHVVLTGKGNERVIHWYHTAIKDEKGGITGTLSAGVDITDRVKAEEQRKLDVEALERSLEQTVQSVADVLESRDPYTAGHQRRVADLASAIGAELGLSEARIHGLHLAGIVHDLGKIRVPAEILSKPGKLSAMEFDLIKAHPQTGFEILKGVEFPWPILQVILQHHERLDGSGYPNGLKGEQICLEARIIAVADVIEAMSSHRPYRAALGVAPALAEIERGKGTAYDEAVTDACLKLFGEKRFAF